MSIKARFALLLGLLLGGFILASLGVRALQDAERERMIALERQSRARMLSHWMEATSRSLPQFVADLAQSEELGGVLKETIDPALARKLSAGLQSAGLSTLWIFRANGTAIFQSAANDGPAEDSPLDASELAALVAETPSPRFFAEHQRDLVELAIRRVRAVPGHDPAWLMVARRWDDAHLRALDELLEARVSLRAGHELAQSPADADPLVMMRPLHDWQGRVLRLLRVEALLTEIDSAIQNDARQMRIFIGFGLAVVAAMAIAMFTWVLRPLQKITNSLATNDPAPVTGLSGEKSEFGRVAELVTAAFAQRAALQQEVEQRTLTQRALERSEEALRQNLEERARLGRDLHDGVIQSLYAAGMGLAGIRMQLHQEQKEAAARLEQTRATLNETIHDVRNFIMGLEPEALKLQTFSQAVTTLLEGMRNMRDFRSTVNIEEPLARRLTLAQRVHALQIAREAVSNALRHGAANTIRVTLQARGPAVEFEVADDGAGFDPGASTGPGKGLANFVQRAHELGAELTVQSSPGGGTRVNLIFSLIML